METLEAWARSSAHGHGWYWVAAHTRNGDLYCICSLARAFREVHGGGHPIRLVVSTPARAELAALFADEFDEIIVEGGYRNLPLDLWDMENLISLPRFGLDAPIVLQPHLRESTFQLTRFAEAHGGTWMEVYKDILRLPDNAEPAPPRRRPQAAEDARRFCAEHGFVEGRSVILFPYAQSLVVDGNAHFAALTRSLTAQGYKVFTSVAPGEAPIEGADPVFIPFSLLVEITEYAGWAVAVRSGICDILAPARCRKTFIYRWMRDFREWSITAMRLALDPYEMVFNFGVGTPEAFIKAVEEGDSLDPLIRQPKGLSALIGAPAEAPSPFVLDFTKVQRRPDLLDQALADIGAHLGGGGVAVIRKLSARNHPGWKALAGHMIDRLIGQLDWERTAAYACRDTPGRDFFEQIEPGMLAQGHYAAASNTHALVLASAPLAASLPTVAHQLISPLEPVPVNDTVAVTTSRTEVDSFDAPDAGPASVRGVQLLSGWSPLEDWGVWSLGVRSLLKLTLAEPPREARIVLVCRAVVSPGFPAVAFTLSINGQRVQECEVRYGEGDVEIVAPIPESVSRDSRSFLLAFDFRELKSPKEQGMSLDTRLLGIGLTCARVEAA